MTLSLVMPVHNALHYLRDALASVIAQRWNEWECVCVDDGSTDGSAELLDECARRDDRIRVLHEKHGGVSAARNMGISACKGDYIGFLDADDTLGVLWLQDVATLIEKHSADVVRLTTQPVIACGFSFLTFVRGSRLKGMQEPFPIGMRLREDTIFLLRLLRETRSVYQEDLLGYNHLDHADSAVHRPQRAADLIRFVDEFIPYAADVGLQQASRAIYISTLWWRIQRDHSEVGAAKMALAALGRAAQAHAFDYKYAPLLWGHSFALADAYMGLRRFVNPQWLP